VSSVPDLPLEGCNATVLGATVSRALDKGIDPDSVRLRAAGCISLAGMSNSGRQLQCNLDIEMKRRVNSVYMKGLLSVAVKD